VLEAREIRLQGDAIQAAAYGHHEVRDRVPVLVRIHMAYRLVVPVGTRATVEAALGRHVDRCPTALSLRGAVDVTWAAEILEG
jgi:organic hydroperoxide reductase OsmC/OhrA